MKTENERIGYSLRALVLRYCARNYGVSQKEIALKIGIHPGSLSRILNGEGASFKMIEKICSVVGGDPSKIIEKGRRNLKYSPKTLEEVLSDARVLRQFVGPTDQTGLDWANKELWDIAVAMKNHRMEIQRLQYYNA